MPDVCRMGKSKEDSHPNFERFTKNGQKYLIACQF